MSNAKSWTAQVSETYKYHIILYLFIQTQEKQQNQYGKLDTLFIFSSLPDTPPGVTANTAGGVRFNNEIGTQYSLQTLQSASAFVWITFGQTQPADRKNVQSVSMFVDNMDGVAYTSNNEIHVSAKYIAGYSGNVRSEITGVLYHEMTHVWQWNGNGQAPGGLIEGIADYVRLKAGLGPSHWVQPGGGDRWDQGYDVTARFLDYCNSIKSGFVVQLNAKMRTGYSNNFFVELTGKTVDQLWSEYKSKYAN